MNATPPPLPSTAKPKNTFFHHAATYCLLAPFVAMGIAFFTGMALAGSPHSATRLGLMVAGLFTTIIIFSGFVFGVISLFGMKRYGTAGILWKAIVGILIFLLLALAAIPNFLAARERLRERYEQVYGHPPP